MRKSSNLDAYADGLVSTTVGNTQKNLFSNSRPEDRVERIGNDLGNRYFYKDCGFWPSGVSEVESNACTSFFERRCSLYKKPWGAEVLFIDEPSHILLKSYGKGRTLGCDGLNQDIVVEISKTL